MEWVSYFKYGLLVVIAIGAVALIFMRKGQ